MAKITKANLQGIKVGGFKTDYSTRMEQVKTNLQELNDAMKSGIEESLGQFGEAIEQTADTIKDQWEQSGLNISIFDYDLIEDAVTGAVTTGSSNELPSDWESPFPKNVDNQKEIYSYLSDMGLNQAAIAGIMGNVQQESGFSPTCSGRDSNGYYSDGLFQWNERWTGAWVYGKTVASQMDYMASHLGSGTLQRLQAVPNTEEGAREAAIIFAREFERCSSASYSNRKQNAANLFNSF